MRVTKNTGFVIVDEEGIFGIYTTQLDVLRGRRDFLYMICKRHRVLYGNIKKIEKLDKTDKTLLYSYAEKGLKVVEDKNYLFTLNYV